MNGSSAPRAVLADLLMATMDSISTWADAAGDRELGMRWRDAVTERMVAAGEYRAYETLVAQAAESLGLPHDAPGRLAARWREMRPWPDAVALGTVRGPLGFVTNCSHALAELAVGRSGVRPTLVLSAEEAGFYKPRAEIYLEACRRLGLRPEQVRFVAGAAYDAIGARSAGLDACLIARRPVPATLDSAIRVVPSLELAVADA